MLVQRVKPLSSITPGLIPGRGIGFGTRWASGWRRRDIMAAVVDVGVIVQTAEMRDRGKLMVAGRSAALGMTLENLENPEK